MKIMRIGPHHVDGIAELERACFSVPWSRESVASELENPVAWYVVAEEGGQLLGYAGMHAILDEGYITNIATSPAHRRRGVADALLCALKACAAERELSFLSLEVRLSNAAAQGLYRKHGFAPSGLRRGYYHSPKEDALIMQLDLLPQKL